MKKFNCFSEEETILCGEQFGSTLIEGSVVCFFGDLGAGKTTFIKGVAKGYSGYPVEQVNSPTFVYLNIYKADKTIYHFDLYRLKDSDEFLSMGFDEMFEMPGVSLLEWSEKINNILPEKRIHITLRQKGEFLREITIDEFNYI